jgi:hypothetical protein
MGVVVYEAFFLTYNLQTDQGIKNFTAEEADSLAGKDPDYATRDLFNSIESGQYVGSILFETSPVHKKLIMCPFFVKHIEK